MSACAAEVKALTERAAEACGALQGAADIIRRELKADCTAGRLLQHSENLLAAIVALDIAQKAVQS